MKPVITEAYRAEQQALHATGKYGTTGARYGAVIGALLKQCGASSLLDYGCGSRRSLLETLVLPPDVVYEGYDPAVPEYAEPPVPADLVCCVDVLEHIEPALLDNVLDHLAELCDPFGFLTVHTGPAVKVLSDGRNAHLTQQPFAWWKERLDSRFQLLDRRDIPNGFVVLVRSLQAEVVPNAERLRLPMTGPVAEGAAPVAAVRGATPGLAATPRQRVEHGGAAMEFATPNEMTAWRVRTLFDKEPDTIRWIEAMAPGSVLLDIGANVGMYSIFAAVTRSATVVAFEPESQNYALLNANIALNRLSGRVTAYPLALSDRMQLDRLFLSEFAAGGSCHSFGEEVGFDLKPRSAGFHQGAFSTTVDQLVESGAMPVPDYIKIDVDGFEHKVIAGAMRTLENPKVKQVLVELNTHLKEHRATMEALQGLGFGFDEAQVDRALRPSGPFEGVGEFIFRREASEPSKNVAFERVSKVVIAHRPAGRAVLHHVLERVADTRVETSPFPHIVVDDVFPADYYREVLAHFPPASQMQTIAETGRVIGEGAYNERSILRFSDEDFGRMSPDQRRFWNEFAAWMYSDSFINAFIETFQAALSDRLDRIIAAEPQLLTRNDALLVHDATNYAIGPHTDSPHRLISLLFYLPDDQRLKEFGTSLYRPLKRDMVCWGGNHYDFRGFERVKTIPFLPNRLVAFPKTAQCFHGVEKIERDGVHRRLLINNIRLLNTVTH